MTEPMQVQMQAATEARVTYDSSAPDIYLDGFLGASLTNNTVKLNLFVDRFNPVENAIDRTIVSRLVLSVPVLVAFSDALSSLVTQLKTEGIIPK